MSDEVKFTQRLDTYLQNLQFDRPKEVFKLVVERIAADGVPETLLDVGCAAGQFLHYVHECLPTVALTGIDTSPELLAAGRAAPGLAGVSLLEADALSHRGEPADVTTCLGVLGIFDDPAPLLDSLIANTKAGGRIFVHSHFNDADIDVRTVYRDNFNAKDWNKGFNIFSKQTIVRCLGDRVRAVTFHRFEMPFALPPNPQQPHRAYTVDLVDGSRRTVNGLCLMLPEHVLEIRL